MARPAATPSARLRALDLAATKASGLKRGEKVTARPMCEMLGVSWPVLRDWCDTLPGFAESGAFQRGGNGIEWVFHPRKVVAFLRKHFESQQRASARRAKKIQRLVGMQEEAVETADLSLDEMAKMIRLSNMLQEQQERQRKLVNAEVAAKAIREMCGSMQQAVLRSAQEQDPMGQWPPEIRESFEKAMRTVLLVMERAGRECLQALGQV